MSRSLILMMFVAAMALVMTAGLALAETDTVDQSVTVTISEIAELGVSGSPAALVIDNPAAAGDLPAAVTNALTTLAWTSNVASGNTRTITAVLDTAMPASVVLKATLTKAGGNGTAAAQQTLSDVAATLFTGITNENVSGNTITFEASVTAMVAPQDINKTVTWTLTEDGA